MRIHGSNSNYCDLWLYGKVDSNFHWLDGENSWIVSTLDDWAEEDAKDGHCLSAAEVHPSGRVSWTTMLEHTRSVYC